MRFGMERNIISKQTVMNEAVDVGGTGRKRRVRKERRAPPGNTGNLKVSVWVQQCRSKGGTLRGSLICWGHRYDSLCVQREKLRPHV